jgi:transcriptional regulator NrdR family protein
MSAGPPDSNDAAVERRKVCELCGTEFSCFTEECWCSELPPIMPLDENKGCLCPECLGREIEQKIKNHKISYDLVHNRR